MRVVVHFQPLFCVGMRRLLLLLLLLCSSEPMDAFALPSKTASPWGRRRVSRHPFQPDLSSLSASPPNEESLQQQQQHLNWAKSAVASTLIGLVLLCSPPTIEPPIFTFLHPAWAQEVESSVRSSVAVLDKLMPPAEEMIPPLPSTRESVLSVLQPQRPTPTPERYSPVMEVWTLVNKYYIDRSFGGQDWDAVRQRYVDQERKSSDNPMRLVTEMIASLGDRYSRVLDARQYAAIQKFDLIGVGVTLMPNDQKQIVVGAPPIPESASQRAGMKLGDIIVSVNGVKTEGRSAFDIIDQISEHPNDKTIRMVVQDAEEGTTQELTMERNVLPVSNPIQYKVSEIRKDGTKVGFIRVLEFNSLVKAKLEEAFEELQRQGCNAFVMDLRGNPGGAFQSAVEISSLFLDNRIATTVVDSSGVRLPFRTATGQVVVDLNAPLAIWVDGGSASASEVLAGSLHDNCRAIVMGDQSFGKGLIQAVYGLKNGAGLVLTVARYVTPNGTEIQGSGVTPDIKGNVPFYFPGFSTDTSKVDFADITKRLDPTMCKVPNQR